MNEPTARALALCGIKIPISQAGLGGVAGPDLAAAVSEAGTDDTYLGHFYSYGWKLGTPYRAIRSRERWNPHHLIAGGARNSDDEKFARSFSIYGGQGVDRIREILGAGEIARRLMHGDPQA
ncbi:MAG: hypothetical protein IH606_23155 [Burkholderiales bacterium]|nr:hypothetical protein [Burkholderiales bacterium]